jgi:hypothetical protein
MVLYAEPGKPWKAKKELRDLSKLMHGGLLVNDRYYGEKTLYTLETLADRRELVLFMTAETRENPMRLAGLFHDLMKDNPNLEVRLYPKKYELHDRYILSDNALLLVGHGIKDLGGSESFLVWLDSSLAAEAISMAKACFLDRWKKSIPV